MTSRLCWRIMRSFPRRLCARLVKSVCAAPQHSPCLGVHRVGLSTVGRVTGGGPVEGKVGVGGIVVSVVVSHQSYKVK